LTIRAGRSAGWCSTLVIGARRFAHPGH
jgi:hypothetical protein